MITTVKQYEDFLTTSYNRVSKLGLSEQISLYRYAYLQLKHDLETFPGHNGTINVPTAFFTQFLDWWDSKSKEERKEELH